MAFADDAQSLILQAINNRIRTTEADVRRANAAKVEAAIEGAESSVDAALIQRLPSIFGSDEERVERRDNAISAYDEAESEILSLTLQLDQLHFIREEYERIIK